MELKKSRKRLLNILFHLSKFAIDKRLNNPRVCNEFKASILFRVCVILVLFENVFYISHTITCFSIQNFP